jgi:hypothetical protein
MRKKKAAENQASAKAENTRPSAPAARMGEEILFPEYRGLTFHSIAHEFEMIRNRS